MTSFGAIQFTKVGGEKDAGGGGKGEFSFRTGEPEMFMEHIYSRQLEGFLADC